MAICEVTKYQLKFSFFYKNFVAKGEGATKNETILNHICILFTDTRFLSGSKIMPSDCFIQL